MNTQIEARFGTFHVCKNNTPPVQLVVAQRPQTGHPLILFTFNHLLLAPKVSFQALALAEALWLFG